MPSSAKPIRSAAQNTNYGSLSRSPFNNSYLATSPIAQASIARDIEEASSESGEGDGNSSSESDVDAHLNGFATSYRRPSFVAYGGSRPTVTPQHHDPAYLTKKEKKESREAEESLLRDNYLAPPKHGNAPPSKNPAVKMWRTLFSPRRPRDNDDPEIAESTLETQPSETSALLQNGESQRDRHERLNRQWEEAVAAGKIKTTWQREAKTLIKYSTPLVITFVLQYSLTVASIFTVGHLGKIELGAVSLASMTANITGYAIYQGLATSLDTLCAQAYGSGKKQLVGLQLQRMVWFLWCLTIPIGFIWFFSERILLLMVPEPESARYAGIYLKVLILGAPGYAAFESGKRFVQAQGLFSATTYVLLLAAPLNALMNWLFVWHFNWGFIGAPIAVAVTDNLLPLFLFTYVYFIDGKDCWNGFTKRAFHNWGPMIKLALPGLLMVEAEFLAFEILTLAASYFSTTHLAAQSILSTLTALTFQIPFSISIAASTRVANLIGATLVSAAKTSAKVATVAACIVGIFNVILLFSLRTFIPQLFTDDKGVIFLVAQVLPLCAAFQLFDALTATFNGLLRGLGRQEVGGYVNLFSYYVIAMPISFGLGFGAHLELNGLWLGVALALGIVAAIEAYFLCTSSWERAVKDAQNRNDNA